MITIEEVLNGFMVCDNDVDDGFSQKYVFESKEGLDKEGLESVADILRMVLSMMCYEGNKHDPYRIKITVEEQE